jgi:hypothetical protein
MTTLSVVFAFWYEWCSFGHVVVVVCLLTISMFWCERQARLESQWAPARWLHTKWNGASLTWIVRNATVNSVCRGLKTASVGAEFTPTIARVQEGAGKGAFRCYRMEGALRWNMVVDCSLTQDGADVTVSVTAFFSGLLPQAVPLAPVLNVMLFFVPFPDMHACAMPLMCVRKLLLQDGFSVSEDVHSLGYGGTPPRPLM